MEGSDCPQYTVLKAHRTDLIRHTGLSLRTFAGLLCDKNVLNDDQYKDIKSCIDRHNVREGAEILVDCVLLSVEEDPELSKMFLDVLKSKGNKGLQTFVRKLEQEIKNSEGLEGDSTDGASRQLPISRNYGATVEYTPSPPQSDEMPIQFCTEPQSPDQTTSTSTVPHNVAYGSIRSDKMWDLRTYREPLKIHFLNREALTNNPHKKWMCGGDPMTTEIILAWATSWNNAVLPCYPRLADVQATKEEAQIRVKFVDSDCQRCWSKVGRDALEVCNTDEPTMILNLYGQRQPSQKSLVLHEFGHVLGLEHEHQRSDFWKVLGDKDENGEYRFIVGEDEMRSGKYGNTACNEHFRAAWQAGGSMQSEYDSDSIMHYWFDTNWLLPKYRDLGYVRKAPDSELTKLQRSVIMGVHRRYFRNGNLAAGPSKLDFETLNDAYKALYPRES